MASLRRTSKSKPPFCSFGQRTRILSEEPKPGPGPQFYDVSSSFTRYGKEKAPAFSFTTGQRFPGKVSTPGPACYFQEKKTDPKKFSTGEPNTTTFGSRDLTKLPSSIKSKFPGPASYGATDLNKFKKSGPSISMGSRLPPKSRVEMIPAPNAYNIRSAQNTAYRKGMCTFGIRPAKKVNVPQRIRDKRQQQQPFLNNST